MFIVIFDVADVNKGLFFTLSVRPLALIKNVYVLLSLICTGSFMFPTKLPGGIISSLQETIANKTKIGNHIFEKMVFISDIHDNNLKAIYFIDF